MTRHAKAYVNIARYICDIDDRASINRGVILFFRHLDPRKIYIPADVGRALVCVLTTVQNR